MSSLTSTITNFVYSQQRLRALVQEFFKDEITLNKLDVLLKLSPDILHRLHYFVSKFTLNRMYNINGIPRCPAEMYKNELRANRKRFFNFESIEGSGFLLYEGKKNPKFLISNLEGSSISMVLPAAVALKWFISGGLLEAFYTDLEEFTKAYEIYNAERRLRYAQKHKLKRKQLRSNIETEVRTECASRIGDETLKKRKCWLSQEDRKEVNKRLAIVLNEKTETKKMRLEKTGNKPKPPKLKNAIGKFVEVGALFENMTPIL